MQSQPSQFSVGGVILSETALVALLLWLLTLPSGAQEEPLLPVAPDVGGGFLPTIMRR